MPDQPRRLSALHGVVKAGTFGRERTEGPGIILSERPGLSITQVAAYEDTAEDCRVVIEDLVGERPPAEPNRFVGTEAARISWIGPHRWWIIESDQEQRADMLTDRLGDRAAVTAQGHGRSCLRLAGPDARDLLSQGCTLDLHSGQFAPGQCAQTSLGHVSALILCVDDDGPTFDLFVPRSYAVSFWEWITDAAGEFGYRVDAG